MDKAQAQRELGELLDIINVIEGSAFQKFIALPMREEEDKLKTAFFSDSLKDAWRKGGKREGIELFFKILKQIHQDAKDRRYELEQL